MKLVVLRLSFKVHVKSSKECRGNVERLVRDRYRGVKGVVQQVLEPFNLTGRARFRQWKRANVDHPVGLPDVVPFVREISFP